VVFQPTIPVSGASEDISCLRPRGHCDRLCNSSDMSVLCYYVQLHVLWFVSQDCSLSWESLSYSGKSPPLSSPRVSLSHFCLSLTWTRWTQSKTLRPISLRLILMLSFHLWLGVLIVYISHRQNSCYVSLLSHSLWSDHLTIPGEDYKLWSSSIWNFLQPTVTSPLWDQYVLLSVLFSNILHYALLWMGEVDIHTRRKTNEITFLDWR
jgi:hypothetical protein